MFSALIKVGILLIIHNVVAYPGAYIPKSYYKIDLNGIASDAVAIEDLFPRLRYKRSTPGDFKPPFFGGPVPPGFPAQFFDELQKMFQQNVIGPIQQHAASIPDGNYDTPNVNSRSGVLHGVDNVHVSGKASGPNGAFSYSSSSIDSDGNAQYSSKTHKF